MKIAGKTAHQTYEALLADRSPYLERARQVARLTLPDVLPEEGYKGSTLPTPYQSVGARGINSLASKLLLALFPPSQSFMRLAPEAGALEDLGQGQVRVEVESSLAQIERAVMSSIESSALRPHLYETLQHLLIAGNVLLFDSPTGKTKVFHLDRYVCKRDPSGNVLLLVTKEAVSKTMLSPEIQKSLQEKQDAGQDPDVSTDEVTIYTAVVRAAADKFEVFQEIHGQVVPGSTGTYKADRLPWIPLRIGTAAGQSYCYGYAASILGDLASLEGLMKALVEASAASARLVFLVNPTSSTSIQQLNRAPNGSFVTGLPDDVIALKVDKASDMGVAANVSERLTKSLGFAFLLNQSVQRAGERVTAEEIRFLAQELEDVLAGTYALLSQELQLPLVRVRLAKLEREGAIPKLEGIAKPTIVTGIEALGRGHDLTKLETFVAGSQQAVGPEVLNQYLNVGVYLKRKLTALSLSNDGLVRDEEEVQEMQAQAQQAQMAQQFGPEVIRQVGATSRENQGE